MQWESFSSNSETQRGQYDDDDDDDDNDGDDDGDDDDDDGDDDGDDATAADDDADDFNLFLYISRSNYALSLLQL